MSEVTVDSTTVTLGVALAASRSFWMKRPWWNERPSGGLEGEEEDVRLAGYGIWTPSP